MTIFMKMIIFIKFATAIQASCNGGVKLSAIHIRLNKNYCLSTYFTYSTT